MRYFLRKIGFFLLTLWAVVTLNFLIPRFQPGDPAEIMVQRLAGKNAQLDPAQVAGDARPARRPDRLAVLPVRAVPGPAAPRQLRGVLQLLPVQGHRGDRAGLLVDGHPGHGRPSPVLRHRGLARRLRRVAPQRPVRHGGHPGVDLRRQPELVLDRAAADLRARLLARLVRHVRRVRGVDARVQLAVRLRRDLARLPAGARPADRDAGRLDPGHAQHDDHEPERGLHQAGQGQGPPRPDGGPALRRPQRAAPERDRVRAGPRWRARWRDPGRDGLRLSRPRPAHGRGGRTQGLPAAAGADAADGSRPCSWPTWSPTCCTALLDPRARRARQPAGGPRDEHSAATSWPRGPRPAPGRRGGQTTPSGRRRGGRSSGAARRPGSASSSWRSTS